VLGYSPRIATFCYELIRRSLAIVAIMIAVEFNLSPVVRA
jgi:hypothetical protein